MWLISYDSYRMTHTVWVTTTTWKLAKAQRKSKSAWKNSNTWKWNFKNKIWKWFPSSKTQVSPLSFPDRNSGPVQIRGGPFFDPEKCLKELILTWWTCFDNPILVHYSIAQRSPPRIFYFAWFSRIEWWFVFVGAPEVIINKEKWGYTMIFCVAPKLIPPEPGGFWTLKKKFW